MNFINNSNHELFEDIEQYHNQININSSTTSLFPRDQFTEPFNNNRMLNLFSIFFLNVISI